jgi:hypothetical protein
MPTSIGLAVSGGFIFFGGLGTFVLPGGMWVDPGEALFVMTASGGILWFGDLPI